MSSVNKAIIVGNLGQDPEIRRMQNGDPVANISVATSERWTNKQGEKVEKTEWHRVSIFGKLADIAEKYLRKGSKVYIEGRIQTRKWQDQQGQDRYTTEIVLTGYDSKLVMLNKMDGESRQESRPAPDERTPSQADELDDEIPF